MGDRVGVELLFNSVEFGPQSSCQQTSRELETRCGRESHTRPRGPSESPDGVDPNIRRTRKTQHDGHNSGVKIWSLCSVSSTLSHATLEQPFRTLAIKWEVNIIVKKSSCVFLLASSFLRLYHASFLHASFCVRLSLFLLSRYDTANEYTTPSCPWQLVKAHRVTRNEPKIYVICYITMHSDC